MTASRVGGRRSAKVSAVATSERYKVEMIGVAYSTHGRYAADGGFDAKLRGIGRVAVHFEQTGEHRAIDFAPEDCSGRAPVVRTGVFRGTIAFRGQRGFTTVRGRSAAGQIRETFRQVCHEEISEPVEPTEPPAPEAPAPDQSATVDAGGGGGGTATYFWAAGPRQAEPPGSGGSGIPTVAFEARYASRFHGMTLFAQASVDSGSNRLSVPTPIGTLTDATVEPPAPFSGSAVFHLESPTAASWTGDLRVGFPGIGKVPLAGPGTTAKLCEGLTCTATLAPGAWVGGPAGF
jgi:hypothetical protein